MARPRPSPALLVRSRVRQLVLAEYALASILRMPAPASANVDAHLRGAAAATHHYTAPRSVAHRVAHEIEQVAVQAGWDRCAPTRCMARRAG